MKTRLLLIAMLIFNHISAFGETEPNNTMQQANALAYNGSQSGSLTGTDTEDWFVVDIPSGGIFTLTAHKTGAGYANVYILDGEKTGNPEIGSTALSYGNSPTEGWSVVIPLLSGRYYVKVSKSADPVDYQLNASLKPPAFPEDAEPNDSVAGAVLMAVNGVTTGTLHYYDAGKGTDQMDWYKLNVPKGGILTLKIHKRGPGNTWIHFLDGNKKELPEISNYYFSFFETPLQGDSWNFPVLAGTYYFKIEGGGNVVDYKLESSLADPAFQEDAEPNDTIPKALSIPVNGTVSGNVHYYAPGTGYDSQDWYKMVVPRGGILNLKIQKKGPGNSWLRFRDGMKNGQPEITSYYFQFWETTGEGEKWSYPVLAGTYYFQVEGGSNVLDYKLDVTLTDPAFGEDAEPNDTITKTLTMPVNGTVSGNVHYYSAGKGIDRRDFYKMEVPKGGILKLKIEKKGPGNTWFYFLDGKQSGNPRISEFYFSYTESPAEGWRWSFPVLSGTYYFQFEGGENIVDYRIETKLDLPVWGEDSENNDSLRFAQKFALNDSIGGLLGYYKPVTGTDNWDWFEINTPEYGYLQFKIDKIGTNNGNIRLRDTTNEIMGQYIDFGDRSFSFGKIVTKGKYYLGLEKFGGDIRYKIKMKLIPIPDAAFTWVQTDNTFAFENRTKEGETYNWDFDDGTKSTAVNPLHDFHVPKDYNVSLIAINIAGRDTVRHTLVIPGVNRIFPDYCGNEGEATIEIFGGGLDTTYDAKIVSGNVVLGLSSMTGYGGNSSILAVFDSLAIAPGKYDFIVEKPGGPTYKLPGGFTVMATTEAKPWIRIVGRNRILFNTWTTYTIEVGNSGNKDAHGVPLWIAISDLPGTDIVVENINRKAFMEFLKGNGWTLDIDSIPDYVQVDTVMGKPMKAKVYPFYIPFIAAGSTNAITVKVRTDQEIQFKAWLQPKYFNSGATDAVWCFISLMGREATGYVIDRFSAKGKCIFDILVRLYSLKGIVMRDPNGPRGISIIPWLWGWANTMAKCGMAFNEAIGILKHFADAVSKYSAMTTSLVDCLMAADAANLNITPANSLDPNEKTGPSGYGTSNYLADGRNFPYTVYFENKASATAPAHTISITDQLDITKFDLSTFGFGNVVIGDSLFFVKPGLKEFAFDKMLNNLKVVARISGNLDTITGKLEWKLRSLDPVTFADIEDPDLGILPPNAVSPQGQGSVSFHVMLKSDPTHNATVTNQASIVFDANPAIITNQHLTTFDLKAPESSVQQLAATTAARQFTVQWAGTDDGSGINSYDIYVKKNNGPYQIWMAGTTATTAQYQSADDGFYQFSSVAADQTGNREVLAEIPDATTQVVTHSEDQAVQQGNVLVSPFSLSGYLIADIGIPGNYTFRIYGTDGRLRMEKRMAGQSVQRIPVFTLSRGLYLWQLVSDDFRTRETGKFVVGE